MSTQVPTCHLFAPDGGPADGVEDRIVTPIRLHREAGAAVEASLEDGGPILIAPDVEPSEVLHLLELRDRSGGGGGPPVLWLRPSAEGEHTALPISLGVALALEDAMARAAGTSDEPLIELDWVLRKIARARHDLNNPLTSALTETQLLLMDVTDPEVREPLQAIERQLHRIRDMVQKLMPLRRPPAE